MIKRHREEIKTDKLNLVPIMDAVFIFIFFLLFSAQFIKLYEIEMEAPIVSDSPTIKDKEEDPLHLAINIQNTKIVVKTGVEAKAIKTFYVRDPRYLEVLNSFLLSLKQQHPEEGDDYAIIAPNAGVTYEQIVKVIESVQKLPTSDIFTIKKKDGKKIRLKKIFTQVVLEPLNET
jgi:biopolymer transport protein ExbD